MGKVEIILFPLKKKTIVKKKRFLLWEISKKVTDDKNDPIADLEDALTVLLKDTKTKLVSVASADNHLIVTLIRG